MPWPTRSSAPSRDEAGLQPTTPGGPIRRKEGRQPPHISTKRRCIRRSGVNSGWKTEAKTLPCRTITGVDPPLPAFPSISSISTASPYPDASRWSQPKTSTGGLDFTTMGARMNTAGSGSGGASGGAPPGEAPSRPTGPPRRFPTSTTASNDCSCRPKPLRRTTTSSAPNDR